MPHDRRDIEQTLHNSEERVRLIVDSSLDAVVTIDEQGQITGWDPQAEVIFRQAARGGHASSACRADHSAWLRHLPVVILTTSAEEQEIPKMYKLRCSSYIVKPVDFDQFRRVIRLISEYWFTVVVLPELPLRAHAGEAPKRTEADGPAPMAAFD